MINGLPERLQGLRVKYGYSQRQVARLIKVSPSIVSGYETGERTPSTEVLLSLAYLYKCSTDYLLGKEKCDSTVPFDFEGLASEQIKAIQKLIAVMRQ